MKIFFVLVLFLMGFDGFCQNNLQFNKIVTYANSNGCNGVYASPIYQVPSGKIWKVERCIVNISYYQDGISKNAVLLKGTMEVSPSEFNSSNPIWLNSGDTMQVKVEGGLVCSSHFFSIIEYNLVP